MRRFYKFGTAWNNTLKQEDNVSITEAVRQVLRENRDAALGNTGVLYFEVCRKMSVEQPLQAPNLGSVHRIWRRFHEYGENIWRNDGDL